MIGDRLARFALCLVREETYTAIVAPAIADLQYEAPLGWPSRVRAYAGAWRALLAATAQEVMCDSIAASRAIPVWPVAGSAASTVACLTLLLAMPVLWFDAQSPVPWHHQTVLFLFLLPTILTFTLPAGALPLAAAYARTSVAGGRRAGFLVGSIAVVMLLIGNQAVKEQTAALRHELMVAASWSLHRSDLRDRPLWEVREIVSRDVPRPMQRDAWRGRVKHPVYVMMLMGLTYTLCGIAASRQTIVRLPVVAVALFVTHGMLTVAFQRVLYVQAVAGYPASIWSPAALLFLSASLAALRSSKAGRPTT